MNEISFVTLVLIVVIIWIPVKSVSSLAGPCQSNPLVVKSFGTGCQVRMAFFRVYDDATALMMPINSSLHFLFVLKSAHRHNT
jgi:hypothetical protein